MSIGELIGQRAEQIRQRVVESQNEKRLGINKRQLSRDLELAFLRSDDFTLALGLEVVNRHGIKKF